MHQPTNQPTNSDCLSILIIEDDHDIRVSLRRALEFEGYYVFSATNGISGFELLKRIKPPGLILLDLMMPLMNGQGFLKKKNTDADLNRIPIVIMSASKDAEAIAAENDGFLQKPVDLKALLEVVHRFCGSIEAQ